MAPAPPAHPGPGPDPGPAPAAAPSAAYRLLREATRHSAGPAAAVLACSTVSAAAAVAFPAVLGHTVDLLTGRSAEASRWVVLCAALVAAEVVFDALVALCTGVTNARSTAWLRTRALAGLLATEPRRAARFRTGDLVTRLSANAAEAGNAPAGAATALAAVLPPVGALVALLLIDLWTAAVFLAGLPVLVLVLRAFTRSSSDSVTRYQQVQSEVATRLVETLAGARTVAAAGTVRRERARILAPLPELGAQGSRMWAVHGRAVARSGVLLPLLVTAVLAVGGIRLAAGDMTLGELLAASRYAALAAGIGAVAGPLGTLVRSRAAAQRTVELLALPPTRHAGLPLPPGGPGTLELRGVTVVRGGAAVLRDVNVLVPGGATAAVVGPSGAGKSVLAAVAGRLTDPDWGEVLLDGVPLALVEPGALRHEIGYAFERPALYGATVGGAIAFGPYDPGPERVRAAADAAGAHTFVRLLPQGYDTPLTDAPLSGGELQRLGLARAFAHAGRLLILDDATSSLDTVTERAVNQALIDDVRPGTRLIVAHRVSSAARADLVIWLDDGRVRATGPHAALWTDPAYRAAFTGPAADGPDCGPEPDCGPVPEGPAGGPVPDRPDRPDRPDGAGL
ncbi:ABC transporter ATP-binding protein [Streptomyces hypolithicus]